MILKTKIIIIIILILVIKIQWIWVIVPITVFILQGQVLHAFIKTIKIAKDKLVNGEINNLKLEIGFSMLEVTLKCVGNQSKLKRNSYP